jgi:hypothetical protein
MEHQIMKQQIFQVTLWNSQMRVMDLGNLQILDTFKDNLICISTTEVVT